MAEVFIVFCSERHKPRVSIRNQHLKLKIRVAGESVVAGCDSWWGSVEGVGNCFLLEMRKPCHCSLVYA